VYDISGKLVKTLINESKPKGSYNAIWDRRNRESQRVSQGIYFFVLKTNSNTQQKKVLLLD
jgi:flagellar hook assembly protein FlgD